jgi:hypothetical protein
LAVPVGWALLAPGDPGLTGRVKKAGPSWVVEEKRGNKVFSRGVWAPVETIERIREELRLERADPAYGRRLEASRQRRVQAEQNYAEDFTRAVWEYLRFAECHAPLGMRLARAVAQHAVPVGSGTVARTQRIPLEQRAEAATIAWLRHATTLYDQMQIARVKGERREVRRRLAEGSRRLLERYRRGELVPEQECVLHRALSSAPGAEC